jgi:hypothetical protein
MSLETISTLQSAGPLLLVADVSPDIDAVLFVADVSAARILAFELPREDPSTAAIEVRVDRLGAKLASLLGVEHDDVLIRGIAAHPVSRAVYLSVARGRGRQAGAVVVRVGAGSELRIVELGELPVTTFELDDAPAADDARLDALLDGSDESSQPLDINGVTLDVARVPIARSTVTDLAWIGGELVVAGMSNEEFSSRLRILPYPFDGPADATSVEVFHVDHGRYETESPIRALTPFAGGSGILATYTCTPVAYFSLGELRGGGLVRGRTVAELGPMNQPFSIVSYDRGGEEFLLVSNTRHPLLKIPAASIAEQPHLDVPVADAGASLGVPRESLDHPGVTWMTGLDRGHVVVVQEADGDMNLRTLSSDVL